MSLPVERIDSAELSRTFSFCSLSPAGSSSAMVAIGNERVVRKEGREGQYLGGEFYDVRQGVALNTAMIVGMLVVWAGFEVE